MNPGLATVVVKHAGPCDCSVCTRCRMAYARQRAGAKSGWCACWVDRADDVVWAVCPTGACDTATSQQRNG
jgi:hypothetical protein